MKPAFMTGRTRTFIAALILALGLRAPVDAATYEAGKHYEVIAEPQRTNVAPGKVEVLEVFSYGCPACNQFQATMKKLRAALPANAQLAYLPASWHPEENWLVFQRAFLAAKSLGVAEKVHDQVFDAIWKTGELGILEGTTTGRPKKNMPTIEDAARFYQRTTGVKAADFIAASKSFTVDLKMRQADAQILAMKVIYTPTLVVNGKYRISNDYMNQPDVIIGLVKFLVAKEAGAGKKN